MSQQNDEQTLIRRYLLGDLDQDRLEGVEERLLCDEAFAKRLPEEEASLIDDYVFKLLSEYENEKFESNFIIVGDRRKQLLISQALEQYVDTRDIYLPTKDKGSHYLATWWQRSGKFLKGSKTRLALSLAVALLLIFVGPTIVRFLRSNLAPVNQRENIERRIAELNRTPDILTQAPGVVELNLRSTLRESSEMSRAIITQDVKLVRLRFTLQPVAPERCNAIISTDTGEELFAIEDLTPDIQHSELVLRIPAELLRTGDYQVELRKATAADQSVVGRYYFRVINRLQQS